MFELTCPYCAKECEPDSEDNDPGRTYVHECDHCGKDFVYTLEYYPVYSERQALCLNGGEHDWSDERGWPPEFFANKQRCKACDKQRVKP